MKKIKNAGKGSDLLHVNLFDASVESEPNTAPGTRREHRGGGGGGMDFASGFSLGGWEEGFSGNIGCCSQKEAA